MRTLLAACTCLAMASPAAGAVFAGRTSQHPGTYGAQRLPSNVVGFTLGRAAVRRLTVPWLAKCTTETGKGAEPALLDRILIVDALPVGHGRFEARGMYDFPPGPGQDATVTFTIRGAIDGHSARGTLSATASITLGGLEVAECKTSHAIAWHARAGRRARGLTAPERSRPRPFFTGLLTYARSDDGGATSALFATVPDRSTRAVQLTRPDTGVVDSGPALGEHPFAMDFERLANGVSQLYVTDPEGFGEDFDTALGGGRLTDFPQGARDPAVFGDIVVFSVGHGADCSLWAADQFGKGQRQISDHGGAPGCDDAPAWGPGGKELAFRRTVTDAAGAPQSVRYLVLSDLTGAARPLDLGTAPVSGFGWAPGRKLAYVAKGALTVVNEDGSGRRVVLRKAGLTGRPAWSPLADRIVVAVRRADGSTDLVAVPADGGQAEDLTDTPGESETDPAWTYPPPRFGGGEPGPSVHVKSQSARPHGRRKRRSR